MGSMNMKMRIMSRSRQSLLDSRAAMTSLPLMPELYGRASTSGSSFDGLSMYMCWPGEECRQQLICAL